MIALVLAAALVQLPAPPQDPTKPPLGEPQLEYEFRCKSCHEPAQDGIPGIAVLAKMKPAAIVRSLERGHMKAMGLTMTKKERRQVAAFITTAR